MLTGLPDDPWTARDGCPYGFYGKCTEKGVILSKAKDMPNPGRRGVGPYAQNIKIA